jgi:predicted O-linked N-acetylglucosamine transferase (SPINDLY family)
MKQLPAQTINSQKVTSLHAAFARGEYRSVVDSAQNWCELEPSAGAAWHLRGAALLALNEAEEARACLETASTMLPFSADVWDHLCGALTLCGEYNAAEECCRKSLKLQPKRLSALLNGAKNARDRGDDTQVLTYADRMIVLGDAGRLAGLRHRADALRRLGRREESLEACRKLRLLQPDEKDLLLAMARMLTDLNRYTEVISVCDDLQKMDPENLSCLSLHARALQSTGRLEEAISRLEAALPLAESTGDTGVFSALAFNYQYLPERTVADNLAHARRFGAAARALAEPYSSWDNAPDPDRVLRLGLVTGDLRQHPVGYFLLDVLAALQNSSIEVTVYDTLNRPDPLTEKIRPTVKQWRIASGLDDTALAELIRSDGIDIAADLAGHSATNRLVMLARKPAPVQFTWAGYLATTGTPGIDYVLADPYCIPPEGEAEFSETVWRMPESTYCFSIPEVELPTVSPPVLKNGYITFGSCNNPDKFNDRVLALWGRVLESVPNSRLLVKGRQWREPSFVSRMHERMAAVGLDPKRVDMEMQTPRKLHLQFYNWTDITLDPFPYSGGTTTAEALWSGAPVLAMKGDRMEWRMAESFLTVTGLRDWLANDADDFVALAVAKAADVEGLVRLRKVQREQVLASLLFDAPRFTGHFETALRGMWKLWCEKSLCTQP